MGDAGDCVEDIGGNLLIDLDEGARILAHLVNVDPEAVAIGMVAAGQIAADMNLWESSAAARQDALITKAALPTCLPTRVSIDDILVAIQSDKKVKAGKVRFVLPCSIGSSFVTDKVNSDQVKEALARIRCCD